MPWLPYKLRDSEVWAKVDEHGELVTDKEGRVDVVYKAAGGAKVYRAGARNLVRQPGLPLDFDAGAPAPERSAKAGGVAKLPDGAVAVWTDGGCRPNPGPGGIGVVVIEDGERRELAEYLGESTNNICELTAIQRGLEMVRDRNRPVVVHSDSSYAIGLLSQNWKPKANVELVKRLRELTKGFPDLRFVKVLAHSGISDNERADQLVAEAVATRQRSERRV